MNNKKIMKLRELEDHELKKELLYNASKDWDDARELFKLK